MRDSFSTLTVYTGNVCGLPSAEQLLAKLLQGTREINVTSTGTHALGGESMDKTAQEIVVFHGVDHPENYRARQLRLCAGHSEKIMLRGRGPKQNSASRPPRRKVGGARSLRDI